MNLGIVGSRNFGSWKLMQQYVLRYILDGCTTVITGDAKGADAIAVRLAQYHGLDVIVHKAHWDLHGKRAGPIRNQKIVDDSDALLAFPSKNGRGTQITIDIANRKGLPVYVVDNWEGEEE